MDTIKDTLTKMRIDGQLMFVHPTPYVSNNMLWLCYYVAKPKGTSLIGVLCFFPFGYVNFTSIAVKQFMSFHSMLFNSMYVGCSFTTALLAQRV